MKPFFRILSDSQIYEIHLGALKILEKTGVIVENGEALEMLRGAGAFVEKKNQVRIPSFLIDEAIRSAPERISVYDRNGKRVLFLESTNSYFGSLASSAYYLDPVNRKVRKLERQDVRSIAILSDYLSNISFVAPGGIISDVPAENGAHIAFKEVVTHTTKPTHYHSIEYRQTKEILEMAAIVAGGYDNLRKNPFVLHYAEPISPLKHTDLGLKKLFLNIDYGIPIIYTPMVMAGGTGPATWAGTLAVNIAEVLSGLLIAQLRVKGAPFIFGGMPGILDMATLSYPFGAAEVNLLSAALAEISRYYQLPMFGTAGCGDGKIMDEQNAIEVSMSCLMSELSGANWIHDVGLIGGASIISPDTITMTDEVIEMVKHMVRSIDVNDETLALDIVDKVGPGGNFIGEEHTARHFREAWYPRYFDRGSLRDWEKRGKLTFGERVNQKTKEIMKTHVPESLPDDILKELDQLEKKWRKT